MKKSILFLPILLLMSMSVMAQVQIEFELFAENFDVPVDMVNDGNNNLFVAEKDGRIMRLEANGVADQMPFLDIRDRVNNSSNEMGLLGIEFHPNYPDSPFIYVNYTATNPQRMTVISRFTLGAFGAIRMDPSTERIILTFDQPYTNHNAGDLKFGPDGYLYIPTGDGGSGGDPQGFAQNPTSLLGKMLRIDVDGGNPYVIPPDNPFANDDFTSDEIWSLGLRNPWRIDFDPLTNELYIADVGQKEFEEINVQPASSPGGQNYGWKCYEGNAVYSTSGCDGLTFTPPTYTYPHINGSFCTASISGGVVYRGTEYPNLIGKYFFADYCTGMVGALYKNSFDEWTTDTVAMFNTGDITSFGRDVSGEVYMIATSSGKIYKIKDKFSSINQVTTIHNLRIKNPVRNQLIIPEEISFLKGKLIAVDGRLVMDIQAGKHVYDVTNLNAGIYLLELMINKEQVVQKLVIE